MSRDTRGETKEEGERGRGEIGERAGRDTVGEAKEERVGAAQLLQVGDSGVAAQGTAEGGDVSSGQLGPVGLAIARGGKICSKAVREWEK